MNGMKRWHDVPGQPHWRLEQDPDLPKCRPQWYVWHGKRLLAAAPSAQGAVAGARRGQLYARARLRRGLSKGRLADLAGVPIVQVVRVENGGEISWETARKLARVFWPCKGKG